MNFCVVIPVYNQGDTVGSVALAAQRYFPVVIVDDGSTDNPALPEVQAIVRFPENRGKGAALRAGFVQARKLGFTHVITLDADGQHNPDELPKLAAACRAQPNALVVGVRDLRRDGAPAGRRRANAVSNFWFRVETGIPLSDTQCGFRAYPLAEIEQIQTHAERYAFELEMLVRAAWLGLPLVAVPIGVSYAPGMVARSHSRPVWDVARITIMNIGLVLQSWIIPLQLRRALSREGLKGLTFGQRLREVFHYFLTDQAQTPRGIAGAVGLGLFCGIAPIWGYQMVAAATLAHFFGLNKAIALIASNISIPPVAPFILYGGLALGHWLFTGHGLHFPADQMTMAKAWEYLGHWFVGSFALGALVASLGTLTTYLVARLLANR